MDARQYRQIVAWSFTPSCPQAGHVRRGCLQPENIPSRIRGDVYERTDQLRSLGANLPVEPGAREVESMPAAVTLCRSRCE